MTALIVFTMGFSLKMIGTLFFTVTIEVWTHLPLGRKWVQNPILSFKDFVQSIFIQYSPRDVTIFDSCVWLIWFARNKLRNKPGVKVQL